MATVRAGDNHVPNNRRRRGGSESGMDSQLTLKDHHAIRLKDGKRAMARLRRLAGQMVRSPANGRTVTTACIQSVAMFGSESWWKGDHVRGTISQVNELPLLFN